MTGFWCPGGFGDRGIEGKMVAIRQARQTATPFLGICLGLQLLVIDHARTVLGWAGANSTEFDPDTPHPVVQHLSEYGEAFVKQLGGTMRLGNQHMVVPPGSKTFAAYSSQHPRVDPPRVDPPRSGTPRSGTPRSGTRAAPRHRASPSPI